MIIFPQTSLGNFQHLQDEKKRLRLSKQLKLLGNNGSEDPISIVTNMRASQPPNAAHDILMLNNSVARQRRKRVRCRVIISKLFLENL